MLRGLLIAAGAYAACGVAVVLYEQHKKANPAITPAPGGIETRPPAISYVVQAAIWPLVLINPYKK